MCVCVCVYVCVCVCVCVCMCMCYRLCVYVISRLYLHDSMHLWYLFHFVIINVVNNRKAPGTPVRKGAL